MTKQLNLHGQTLTGLELSVVSFLHSAWGTERSVQTERTTNVNDELVQQSFVDLVTSERIPSEEIRNWPRLDDSVAVFACHGMNVVSMSNLVRLHCRKV